MHAAVVVPSPGVQARLKVQVYYAECLDVLGLWRRSNLLLNLRQT
jgi:hypothetical protein